MSDGGKPGTRDALPPLVGEETVHGMGVAPEQPRLAGRDARSGNAGAQIPDEPAPSPRRARAFARPVLTAQEAPWRGAHKRKPHRLLAQSLAEPETVHQRTRRSRPGGVRAMSRGKMIALFVAGVMLGLLALIIVVSL